MEWLLLVSTPNKIYLGLLATNVIIILINFTRIDNTLRPLLLLVISNLLVELWTDYIKVTTNGNNLFIYHLYAPIEYTCLGAIFYLALPSEKHRKRIIGSIIGYIIVVVISTIFWQSPAHNNSITYMIESALVIYWCFIFFRTLLDRQDLYVPERDGLFWLFVAILIYFAGTFFTIGLIDYFIISNQKLATFIYYASFPFNYILYVTIGIVCLLPSSLRNHE
ncbi:hypothetical protein GGR92_001623 [Spirosoma lacussanchae]|uniref:hypothetical protein n=1 Tax=Spirosoma lacussanchae TaxID=1884249 RepID=UPI001107E7AB|nr:hypothetical protein [Spirosoma lacussanchae]